MKLELWIVSGFPRVQIVASHNVRIIGKKHRHSKFGASRSSVNPNRLKAAYDFECGIKRETERDTMKGTRDQIKHNVSL